MSEGRAGDLLRAARIRHGLDQRTLARLAGTSQTQVSRIERGEVSPRVGTLARLLAALGEDLELGAVPARVQGSPGFFPDHDAERSWEYARSTPAERVIEAMRLSATATALASARA
jgi:transcriptional regulator with XRE-family HTH domain